MEHDDAFRDGRILDPWNEPDGFDDDDRRHAHL
jgi:hypothetical protein